MANIGAHRGSEKHLNDADLFSATLKCHDPKGELYVLCLTRDRITVSSYTDDTIFRNVETWVDTLPELC